jgi:hypothetical protein
MELGLNDLVDSTRIVQIDADSLPSIPHAARQGNHLYVNCHYSVEISGHMPRTELYETARADVLEIVRRLTTYPAICSFLSINVRVIGHFPYPEMKRPAIRRIYAVSIDTENLPRSAAPITPETLPAMKAFEDSQLNDAPPMFAGLGSLT